MQIAPVCWPAKRGETVAGDHLCSKLEMGLTAQRIYQDLVRDHGYGGSYCSVRRLRRKLNAGEPTPFRRMESEPADLAQLDFVP